MLQEAFSILLKAISVDEVFTIKQAENALEKAGYTAEMAAETLARPISAYRVHRERSGEFRFFRSDAGPAVIRNPITVAR